MGELPLLIRRVWLLRTGFVGSKFGRGSTVILMDRIVLRSLEAFAWLRRRRWRFECRTVMATLEKSEDDQLARLQARVAGYQIEVSLHFQFHLTPNSLPPAFD